MKVPRFLGKKALTFALTAVAIFALAVAIRFGVPSGTALVTLAAEDSDCAYDDATPPDPEILGTHACGDSDGASPVTLAEEPLSSGQSVLPGSTPRPSQGLSPIADSQPSDKPDLDEAKEEKDRREQSGVAQLPHKSHLPVIVGTGPTTYYVSKAGSNVDGLSWASAWNELNQINWYTIEPGDTIFLDGGSTEIVYTSTLTIGKSGTFSKPITITLTSEVGRDGRAVIFGGRSTPLPYCGQDDYAYQVDGVRDTGIFLDQKSWVLIDGRKWRGIVIHGHNKRGIRLYRKSGTGSLDFPLNENIVFRNLEIYDNGYAYESEGAWNPDGMGVGLTGRNITFERTIVHDNGQDAFISGGPIEDITLRRVWLYNSRPHPDLPGEAWNHCTHSDGVQVYGGGNQYGFTIEDSIIGPGFNQGLLFGDFTGETRTGMVHDVTISNTLCVGHHGPRANSCLTTLYDAEQQYPFPNDPPTNYVINQVTFVRDPGDQWWNILAYGSGHTVVNSIFSGGLNLYVEGEPVVCGNYWWQLNDQSGIGIEADPMFVDDVFPGVGSGFADFDFETQNPIVSGAGSSITKPDDLFGDPLGD